MTSYENENQFYQFLIFLLVHYLIDPDYITFYRRKSSDQFHPNVIFETTRKIAKFCSFAIIQADSESPINSL